VNYLPPPYLELATSDIRTGYLTVPSLDYSGIPRSELDSLHLNVLDIPNQSFDPTPVAASQDMSYPQLLEISHAPIPNVYSPCHCPSNEFTSSATLTPEAWSTPSAASVTPPISTPVTDLEVSTRLFPERISPVAPKFACKVDCCYRRFTQQRQLDNHMRRHQLYSCDACPATYPHSKSLREHKQTKHQGKRYTCDVPGCTDTVAQRKNLARHKIIKHGTHPTNRPACHAETHTHRYPDIKNKDKVNIANTIRSTRL
jgi:hypothetical protein